ncbi:hypothetical protein KIPB_013676, partial [Kipferlia bialata]
WKVTPLFRSRVHKKSVRALAFHRDGSCLASVSADGSMCVMVPIREIVKPGKAEKREGEGKEEGEGDTTPAETWRVCCRIKKCHEKRPVNALHILDQLPQADGDVPGANVPALVIVTGDDDGYINVWGIEESVMLSETEQKIDPKSVLLTSLSEGADIIYSITYSPNNRVILAVSGDGTIYMYRPTVRQSHVKLSSSKRAYRRMEVAGLDWRRWTLYDMTCTVEQEYIDVVVSREGKETEKMVGATQNGQLALFDIFKPDIRTDSFPVPGDGIESGGCI